MSSSRQPPDSPDLGRRQSSTGFGRAYKRLKTAFRPKRSRHSSAEPSASRSAPSTTAATPPLAEEPLDPLQDAPEDPVECAAAPFSLIKPGSSDLNTLVVDDEEPCPSIQLPNPTAYLGGTVQRERTQQLFSKYGLDFEAYDWIPQGPPPTSASTRSGVMRVEKRIRMRIRYTCHRCQTIFGASPKCAICDHLRCKKCARHPPRKPKGDPDASSVATADDYSNPAPIHASSRRRQRSAGWAATQPTSISVPTVRPRSDSDGSAPMRVQRTRHTCHECETDFAPGSTQMCSSCGHQRCSRCPRQPAAPSSEGSLSDSDGAMADSEGPVAASKRPEQVHRKPRQRARWKCHQCSSPFAERSKVCSGCLHRRCYACARSPYAPDAAETEPAPAGDDEDDEDDLASPKAPKVEPEPGPATVAEVQTRLDTRAVTPAVALAAAASSSEPP